MGKVNWKDAPKDAEAYIDGAFIKWHSGDEFEFIDWSWEVVKGNWTIDNYSDAFKETRIEMRPDNWKEGEKRMEQIAQNGNDGQAYDETEDGKLSAYHRKVKGVWIDFYDIANAFDPENRNSADDHALKKMLLPGKRHTKGGIQDRKEAIQSIERAIELESDK